MSGVKSNQRGMVLVTSLLLLVVVTVLAVAMFRSFGVDERIAGNLREKQRALNAAESAEQYAEAWLAAGLSVSPVACSAMVSSNVGQVCTNTMAAAGINPAVVPWQIGSTPVGVSYTPQVGSTSMTVSTTGGAGTYSGTPAYYIAFLGNVLQNRITTTYYQIDAVGYGGTSDATAVVEATYTTTTSATPLSNP